MEFKRKIKNNLFRGVILLASLLVSGYSFSQKNEIHKIANQMFIDINNKDFDAIVDMTYPKVFEMASKEDVKSLMRSMFDGNKEYSVQMSKKTPKYKISRVFNDSKDNIEYAFVSYNLRMKMVFHNKDLNVNQKKRMINSMRIKGVSVKSRNKNLMKVVMKDKITIVLRDNLTNGKWKLLDYNPDSPLFSQVTPSSVKRACKKYKQDLKLKREKRNKTSKFTKN